MLRVIHRGHIIGVKHLAPPHPVFLLTFLPDRAPPSQPFRGLQKVSLQASPDAAGEHLVIKGELIAGGNEFSKARYQVIAEVMNELRGRVESQVLTPYEVQELRNAVVATPTLKEELDRGCYFFVKMKYVKGSVNLISVPKSGDIQELRALFRDLRANSRAWESLGEIIAADVFVGNRDRISIEQDGKVFLGNPGNVFFKQNKVGLVKRALALDIYDPMSYVDTGDILAVNDDKINNWFQNCGILLRYDHVHEQFAKRFVASIVEHFAKAGVSVTPDAHEKEEEEKETHYFTYEENCFLAGFRRGIAKLKDFVWAKGSGLPGVTERARLLGWVPPSWGSVTPPGRSVTPSGRTPGAFLGGQRKKD